MKDLLILFTIAAAGILCICVDVNVTIKPFKVQISNLKESIFIIAIFFLCTLISAISYNTGRQEGAKQAIELMTEINELEKQIKHND